MNEKEAEILKPRGRARANLYGELERQKREGARPLLSSKRISLRLRRVLYTLSGGRRGEPPARARMLTAVKELTEEIRAESAKPVGPARQARLPTRRRSSLPPKENG